MSKRALRGLVGFFLVAVLVFVGWLIGWQVTGFKNPLDWGKTETTEEASIEDGVVIKNGKSDGIRLMSARIAVEDYDEYGVSFYAESAQLLTASFTPSDTTFQEVSWTVSGGQGKVQINSVDGKPLQATVTVTGSFSQQATVTCTASNRASGKKTLTATATVDYLKTPSFSWKSGNITVQSIKDDFTIDTLPFFDNNTTGTLPATKVLGTVSIYNRNYSYLKNSLHHNTVKEYLEFENVDLLHNTLTFNFADFLGDISDEEKEQIYRAVAEDDVNIEIIDINYTNVSFYYNDYEYYWYDGDMNIGVGFVHSFDDVFVFADDVELDKDGLVFFPAQPD